MRIINLKAIKKKKPLMIKAVLTVNQWNRKGKMLERLVKNQKTSKTTEATNENEFWFREMSFWFRHVFTRVVRSHSSPSGSSLSTLLHCIHLYVSNNKQNSPQKIIESRHCRSLLRRKQNSMPPDEVERIFDEGSETLRETFFFLLGQTFGGPDLK